MKTVAKKVRDAGDSLLQALRDPGSSINECLNTTLNEFLAWPFRAGPACVTDTEGDKATFGTVIYAVSGEQSKGPKITIGADAAACVVQTVRIGIGNRNRNRGQVLQCDIGLVTRYR